MSRRFAARETPVLALNAIRLIPPAKPIPATLVEFDAERLHAFLDRPGQDVFATRYREDGLAIIPLTEGAVLPGPLLDLPVGENMRLFAALAREAIFRRLLDLSGNYRVVNRRPPIVESAKQENVIPASAGLPPWLKKRIVLAFETRIITHPGEDPYVVLTCDQRICTVIEADCGILHQFGVPLVGNYVSNLVENPDPGLRDALDLVDE
jgi:hypothetical protein